MSIKLVFFLLIGTALMSVPIMKLAEQYGISRKNSLAVTLLLTISGTMGTLLMFYVENQRIGGLSFYGAVFLVPILFLGIAPVLKIPYGDVMDLCAVGECIMLALMKVHCMLSGCCRGKVLFTTDAGTAVVFPSRSAELLMALIIFMILMRWALKQKHNRSLYAWYLLIYGSTRFVLNIFRAEWVSREMLLPFGNIWSLVAIAIGAIWLMGIRRKDKQV